MKRITIFDRLFYTFEEPLSKNILWLKKLEYDENSFSLHIWNNGDWRDILHLMWVNRDTLVDIQRLLDEIDLGAYAKTEWCNATFLLKGNYQPAGNYLTPSSLNGYATTAWTQNYVELVLLQRDYVTQDLIENFITESACLGKIQEYCDNQGYIKEDLLKDWVEKVIVLPENAADGTVVCYIGEDSQYTYGGLYKCTTIAEDGYKIYLNFDGDTLSGMDNPLKAACITFVLQTMNSTLGLGMSLLTITNHANSVVMALMQRPYIKWTAPKVIATAEEAVSLVSTMEETIDSDPIFGGYNLCSFGHERASSSSTLWLPVYNIDSFVTVLEIESKEYITAQGAEMEGNLTWTGGMSLGNIYSNIWGIQTNDIRLELVDDQVGHSGTRASLKYNGTLDGKLNEITVSSLSCTLRTIDYTLGKTTLVSVEPDKITLQIGEVGLELDQTKLQRLANILTMPILG